MIIVERKEALPQLRVRVMQFKVIPDVKPEQKEDWSIWYIAQSEDDDLCGVDTDCPVCGSVAGQCCSDINGREWGTREHMERHTKGNPRTFGSLTARSL